MKIFIFCITIHLLFTGLLFFLRYSRILRCEYISVFIALFVPVWGPLMLLGKELSDRHNMRPAEVIELERPTAEEEKKSIRVEENAKDIIPLSEALVINDETTRRDMMMDILYNINKSIVVDQDDMNRKVVPLEEALVVNDTATRRELIIDVLYKNPGDYVSQLYEAKSGGDTEIVHYAATALAEIRKDFDKKFQSIHHRMQEDPENERLEAEYEKLLEDYISCGLLEGEALKKQLRIYSDLLEKDIEKGRTAGRWTLLNKKAVTDQKLGDAAALDRDIRLMEEQWPDRERVYLYRMQSAILKKDSGKIRQIIDTMKEKHIHLSPELKSLVGFWEAGFGE
ncbi:MAG: hypothetical protein K5739_11555 [Lachnospiraceae bacterium]|nr:hypothetical protein [Lachnospiraceae bacterium]